jgi:cytochrome c oxidase subunit 2
MAGLFGRQNYEVLLPDGGRTAVTADEGYLRESILNSTAKIVPGYGPVMPSYRGQISEEELLDLIAYIKSLKDVAEVKSGGIRAAQDQHNPTPAVGR